tara:strand:- start:58751 stop:60673 length:1923 start_codon:yes stop_codon:yes gene_type:complete
MPAIANYYASLGFRVDKKELRKVDTHLKKIERRLKRFSKGVDNGMRLKIDLKNFDVDERKLRMTLGNAFDRISQGLVFQINKFAVNERNLRASMLRAARRVGDIPVNANVRDIGGVNHRTALGAGGIAGMTSSLYYGAMRPAFVAGAAMYGLGRVNRMNQEVVSAQLQTQAVAQAYGGTAAQGEANFNWLREQADRVGFSYMDASSDFNMLTSNLLGTGATNEEARQVFMGFSEYGRVNKLSNARQNLVFNALGQIAGKNALQAEELTKQLGNSLPGAKSIFAEAWQRKTGGRLQGQQAIAALEEAMQKGLVKGDILTIAAQIASEMAQPGLSAASRASQAEQNRFRNMVANSSIIASDNGLEQGYARLFRSMTVALKEAEPTIVAISKAFNEISKVASAIILIPQSIRRAFEGRDSLVADLLGEENVQLLKSFTEGLSDITSDLKGILTTAVEGWKLLFNEFGDEILAVITSMTNVLRYSIKALNQGLSGDISGMNNSLRAVRGSLAGMSPTEVAQIAQGQGETPSLASMAAGYYGMILQNSPPGQAWERMVKPAWQYGLASVVGPGYSKDVPWMAKRWEDYYNQQNMANGNNTEVTFGPNSLIIQTQATDAEGIARDLKPALNSLIGEELLMWGQGEN